MTHPLSEPDDSRLTIESRHGAHGDTPPTLILIGELDVWTVNALCDTAVGHMKSGQHRLHLDLDGVTMCDNGSLFAVLGLRHALQTAGGDLDLTAVSKTVRDAIARNGLGHILHRRQG